ncbi:MAG: N-acetylmuramoyl-L-alanine amidase [Planctomycetes bacterium]|nr:N-acetylmuramoyl-L-alanine amidase [Planctomycetota bacterium]
MPQRPAGGPPTATRVRPMPPAVPVLPQRKPPALSGNPWRPGVKPRNWKSIVIHHTATSRGSVESIHAAHLRRKDSRGRHWKGIGYHFVIGNGNGMPDGAIEPTFRWRTQMQGAHAGNLEYNQTGIGIALVGNFEKQRPSRKQLIAVKRLIAVLKREYDIAGKKVIGHRRLKATACPGRFFPLAEVSGHVPAYLYSHESKPGSAVRIAVRTKGMTQ